MDKVVVKRLAVQSGLMRPEYESAELSAAYYRFVEACCAWQREKILLENGQGHVVTHKVS